MNQKKTHCVEIGCGRKFGTKDDRRKNKKVERASKSSALCGTCYYYRYGYRYRSKDMNKRKLVKSISNAKKSLNSSIELIKETKDLYPESEINRKVICLIETLTKDFDRILLIEKLALAEK